MVFSTLSLLINVIVNLKTLIKLNTGCAIIKILFRCCLSITWFKYYRDAVRYNSTSIWWHLIWNFCTKISLLLLCTKVYLWDNIINITITTDLIIPWHMCKMIMTLIKRFSLKCAYSLRLIEFCFYILIYSSQIKNGKKLQW